VKASEGGGADGGDVRQRQISLNDGGNAPKSMLQFRGCPRQSMPARMTEEDDYRRGSLGAGFQG
jgi:hypothetical protein